MASETSKRSVPEFGKTISASVAAWERSAGAGLLVDLLSEPALSEPDPKSYANTMASRAAELVRSDYLCICTADAENQLKVIAEAGREDPRLLLYVDQHAGLLTSSSGGGGAPSVHSTTGSDPASGRCLSYALTVVAPKYQGRLYIAAFREAASEREVAGFGLIELERLRWFAAVITPLLAHANRLGSARNALRAECGAVTLSSYAAIAHQLLFTNVSKGVLAHLADVRSALSAASGLRTEGDQEEYLRRVMDAANLLERYTSRAHLEAEADARLPRDQVGPLHTKRFLEMCVASFTEQVRHVRVDVVSADQSLRELPVLRVDLSHLEKAISGLIGLAASWTPCGATLILESGVTPNDVWFRWIHYGTLSDPEGPTRDATIMEALAQAVGGAIVAGATPEGGTHFTLSIPREDSPATKPVTDAARVAR